MDSQRLDSVRLRLLLVSKPSVLWLSEPEFLSPGSVLPPAGLVEKVLQTLRHQLLFHWMPQGASIWLVRGQTE